jgi:hypothetical protein
MRELEDLIRDVADCGGKFEAKVEDCAPFVLSEDVKFDDDLIIPRGTSLAKLFPRGLTVISDATGVKVEGFDYQPPSL